MLDYHMLKGATRLETGLCLYLNRRQQQQLVDIVRRLGYYSGDRQYPIEHPTGTLSARQAYYSVQCNYLDSSCPYCRRRIEVLNILLEEIT